jgi:hypothetical protein
MKRYGLDSSGVRLRPVEGSCEHGYEHPRYVNWWRFLENLLASQENSFSMQQVR